MSDLVALLAGFAVGGGVVVAILSARRGAPVVVAAATPAAAPPVRRSPPPVAAGPAARVDRPAPSRPTPPTTPPVPSRGAGPVAARLSVKGSRTSVDLGPDPVTIGRGSDQALRVSDSKASRAHAIVRPRRKGGWQLEDAGSANGTRVNDQRVPEGRVVPLRDGDRIGIGGTTIVYSEQPAEPVAGPDATRVL